MHIEEVEFFSFLLFALVAHGQWRRTIAQGSFETNRCSPEYCNFAGECTIFEGKPTCKCYDEAFEGEYCEQVKNLCNTDKNICTPKESCVSYVGQTICDSPSYRSGYDHKSIEASKPMCYYNIRAVHGIAEPIVLSFENVDTDTLEIAVSTPTYLIANVPHLTGPRARTVSNQHTNNLTQTLQDLRIRRHMSLPYNNARYYVFTAKHLTLGANELTVSIASFGKNPQSRTLSLMVHVVAPKTTLCIPDFGFKQGKYHVNPRIVNVERFTNVQALIFKRCENDNSKISTQWTINNQHENFAYYTKPADEQLLFKIPRYTLWYRYLLQFYPNLILTVQLRISESGGPWSAARCYINVTAPYVIAAIEGGFHREVDENSNWVYLDGSKSREPAVRADATQPLTYTWILENGRFNGTKYLNNQDTSPMLRIPVNYLEKNIDNKITLMIRNRVVASRTSTTMQVIRLVSSKKPIRVEIECVKNCNGYYFAVGHILHLRALCYDCGTPIFYTWKLNGELMTQKKHRFIYKLPEDAADKLKVEVYVKTPHGDGYNEFRMEKLHPPSGGSCTVLPKVGFECDTPFLIACDNYTSNNNQPVTYTTKTGNIFEDISYSSYTFIYLNNADDLTIRICSSPLSCIIEKLSFTISTVPLRGPATFQTAILHGRRQQAFCYLQSLLRTPENVPQLLNYFQAIEEDDTLRFFEMINTLELANIYVSLVPLINSYEAFVISVILKRVTKSLEIIRNDTEILDMKETHLYRLSELITNIVGHFLTDNTEIVKQNYALFEFDAPREIEGFVEWSSFDSTVVDRISWFLRAMKLIFYVWKIIGEESVRYIEPDEPFEYFSFNVSIGLQMHEVYDAINYVSNSTHCKMRVPLPSVEAQRWMLGTNDLLLYTWCFDSNIFWWAPEAWAPTNAVLAVQILGRNSQSSKKLNSKQWYKLSLGRNEENKVILYEQTDEVRNNMVIYKVKLQGPVNMLVKFINSTARLQVLITMNTEPSLINLHDKSCEVPKGGKGRMIVLKYRCSGEGMAYIAVFKTASLDTASALYTFRLSAQECLVWGLRDDVPHWVKNGCYPQNLHQSPNYYHCDNDHLSIFSAKEYVIKPLPIQQTHSFAFKLPLNVPFVVFICLLAVTSILLLIWGKRRLNRKKMNLIRVIKSDRDEVDPSEENVIVHLQTAGILLGKTTANVILKFLSDLGQYKIVIYQNPIDPHLELNTSCLIRVSSERVQLPCAVTITQDKTGRYPSWYCRAIQVDDLRRDLSYTFHIHKWVKYGHKIRVSCLPTRNTREIREVTKTEKGFKRFIIQFRFNSKYYFTNWFMMQPVLGPWRFSDRSCNIYERTCFWICKTILTITIVLCYYRNTTITNFFMYEQPVTILGVSDFLALAVGTYIANLFLDYLLHHMSRIQE